jgi:RHS repeat-associated protein
VTDAAGNNVLYSYPTGAAPNSSSLSMSFNGGSSAIGGFTTTDGLGRVSIRQRPQGANSSTYDSTAYSYDSRGRLNCSTSVPYSAVLGSYSAPNSANGVCRAYDALDRTAQWTDPGGGTVTTAYNLNDATQTTGPAPSGENVKQRSYEYNGAGQITSVCEVTTLAGSGSCSQNTAHTGYLTKYTYQASRLVQTKQNAQATAQTRTTQYDGLGRVTSETIPEWSAGTGVAGTMNYIYDSDSGCNSSSTGDLIKTVDNSSNLTCRTYDSRHRVLNVSVPSGPYSGVTPNMYYVYDAATYDGTAMRNAAGNLAEAYTMSGSTLMSDLFFSRSFSTSGATSGGAIMQLWEKTPNSSGYYQTTDTSFPNGALGLRHTNYGVPDVSYGIDGEGRPKTATDTTNNYNLVTGASFNTAGTATSISYGNGDSDSFGFDSGTNRPTSLLYTITGNSPFTVTTNLTWNANWSLQQMQIIDTNDSSKNQICTYSADDLRRIASVNCGSNTWAQNFAYDAFGNINKNGVGNATSYIAAYSPITNQVSGGPSYDSNGNQLNSTGLSSISWNAAGVPVSVTPLSGGSISGTYDALGRLVETTSGGTTKQFLYGSSSEKVAVVQGSTLIRGTIALPGGETALYNASSGPPIIRHKDWLGSSRLATTWAHVVQSKTAYAPFGETYNETGTADRSFTGQDQDTVTGSVATGIYDYLFRKYDPAAGRWLSPDPSGWGAVSLEDPQSLNRYAYVENQPLNAVDIAGLDYCVSSDGSYFDAGGGGCGDWQRQSGPPAPPPPPTSSDCNSANTVCVNGGNPPAPPDPPPPDPPSPPPGCASFGDCQQPNPGNPGNVTGQGTGGSSGGNSDPNTGPDQALKKITEEMAKKGTPMGGMPFKTVAKLIDCISNLAKDDGKKLRDITQNNRNGVDPLANFQQCIQNAIDSMTNPFQ